MPLNRYNICTSCGKNCLKSRNICFSCSKNIYPSECAICGNIFQSKKKHDRTCSLECMEKLDRLDTFKEEQDEHINYIYDGDTFSVWTDDESVFFSFPYGVFRFDDLDLVDSIIHDMYHFIEYIQSNSYDNSA